MIDHSHLDAIQARIDRETERLSRAVKERNSFKPGSLKFRLWQNEVDFREREIASAKKERASERKFLGLPETDPVDAMSIDELLWWLRP